METTPGGTRLPQETEEHRCFWKRLTRLTHQPAAPPAPSLPVLPVVLCSHGPPGGAHWPPHPPQDGPRTSLPGVCGHSIPVAVTGSSSIKGARAHLFDLCAVWDQDRALCTTPGLSRFPDLGFKGQEDREGELESRREAGKAGKRGGTERPPEGACAPRAARGRWLLRGPDAQGFRKRQEHLNPAGCRALPHGRARYQSQLLTSGWTTGQPATSPSSRVSEGRGAS